MLHSTTTSLDSSSTSVIQSAPVIVKSTKNTNPEASVKSREDIRKFKYRDKFDKETKQKIKNKTKELQDIIVNFIIETQKDSFQNFSSDEELKTVITAHLTNIWATNLEFWSFPIMATVCGSEITGIYYPDKLPLIIQRTGHGLYNILIYPRTVFHLKEYSEKASFDKVGFCEESEESIFKSKFKFENSTIFIPVRYTVKNPLGGEKLKKVLESYLSRPCKIIVYLGVQEGKNEDITKKYIEKRNQWIKENAGIVEDLAIANPDRVVNILDRAEIITHAVYHNVESCFVDHAIFREGILVAMVEYINDCLIQDKYLNNRDDL